MEFGKLIGTFLLQPLLWLGVLWTFVSYSLRMKNDRQDFKVALNKDNFEIRHFLKKGILWGVICSIISFSVGIIIPMKLIFLYEILASIAVLFIQKIDLSTLPLFIIGIIEAFYNSKYLPFILILLGLNYWVKRQLINDQSSIWLSPHIVINNRRQRKIVQYSWSEFTVLPLFLYIPGKETRHFFHCLPLITLGHVHFSLFVLPFFVGSAGLISKLVISQQMKNAKKQNMILSLFSFIFAIIALITKLKVLVFGITIVLVIGMHCYQFIKSAGKHSRYGENSEGVLVIAIRPETPAAKMSLNPGDIILTCNNQPVQNENQFYQALQLNSAYCHLKVKSLNGDLKITESAIYNDSPYELGIVQFTD